MVLRRLLVWVYLPLLSLISGAGTASGAESLSFDPEAIMQSARESEASAVVKAFSESPVAVLDISSKLKLKTILRRMPGRNVGFFNVPGDPVNMVFLGTQQQVEDALRLGGWASISTSWAHAIKEGMSQVAHHEPLTDIPPMEPFWIDGRREDSNWVIPVTLIKRHHFRLWRTDLRDELGRQVWWGSASYDNGVNWSRMTHATDPDRDKERDYIKNSLADNSGVESSELSQPLPQIPLQGVNNYDEPFQTDGRALILTFR